MSKRELSVEELAEIRRVQKTWAEEECCYTELRQAEYPSIRDQLDMLWHAVDSGEDLKQSLFYTRIKAIKDKHPKPQ